MSKERWKVFLAVVNQHALRPILAIVPDNHDPELKMDSPDPQFWDEMRTLEARGATIAMHGYRHLCESAGKQILGLHRKTEFASVEETTQRQWIHDGLAILRRQGLSPRLFVAPRHGFDRATLRALAAGGLGFLSDGFATRPFTLEKVVCIPQQLWEPVEKKAGLWTICIHTNTAPAALEGNLRRFLTTAARQFVCFDDVLENYVPSSLSLKEQLSG